VIVLGTTLAAFAMNDRDTWGAWLYTIDQLRARGHDIQPFAAIEIDGRGLAPFAPLLERLREVHGEHWTYSLDDGRTRVSTVNRLRHLTMGQNLVSSYASDVGASHLLFCAADCAPPVELDELLALRHGYVGPEISTYCLPGEDHVEGHPGVQRQSFLSVACVLIEREVFTRLRWRTDRDLGMSDDPSYAYDVQDLFGIDAWCHKGVRARHYPEAIGPIESRGHDLRVIR
jgi:hypothetical protein